MKYLKYLLLLILFSNCEKDSAEEQEPVEQYIPIGEVTYAPTANPDFTWQTNVEVANDSIFVVGSYSPNQDDEGIYMAKFNDSLVLDLNVFPINDLFQLETRKVRSHIVNDNMYITHGYTANNYAYTNLIKANLDGEVIWENELTDNIFIMNITSLNNQVVLYGFKDWNGSNSLNYPVTTIILDESGNIVNQIDLGSIYASSGDITSLNDGTLLISCLKRDEGPDDLKPYLVNFDVQGNILWETQLGYYDDFVFRFDLFHVEKGTDGIYFTYTGRIGNPPQIGKVTFDGELLWRWDVDHLWFGDTFEQIEDLVLDQNNNIYLIGSKRSNNSGDLRMAMAKYSSDGSFVQAYLHPPAGYWGQSFKILNNELVTVSRTFPNYLVSIVKFDFDFELR